jgi:hypothetical protein
MGQQRCYVKTKATISSASTAPKRSAKSRGLLCIAITRPRPGQASKSCRAAPSAQQSSSSRAASPEQSEPSSSSRADGDGKVSHKTQQGQRQDHIRRRACGPLNCPTMPTRSGFRRAVATGRLPTCCRAPRPRCVRSCSGWPTPSSELAKARAHPRPSRTRCTQRPRTSLKSVSLLHDAHEPSHITPALVAALCNSRAA